MRASFVLFAAGSSAFSLLSHPPSLHQPRAAEFQSPALRVAAGERSGAVRCAYNPQPSKSRPKKKKSKEPKQKVKAPVAPTGVSTVVEQTFWEGPPSATETLIPGLSLFTVVGAIPFTASLARQAWTRYKITNRRLEVKSGFQGRDVVQISWREVEDVKWLRRYGGAAGDLVFTLKDNAKLELRSMPDFDRNLCFIMNQLMEGVAEDSEYPDGLAQAYLDKVASGELEKPELPALEGSAPAAPEAAEA